MCKLEPKRLQRFCRKLYSHPLCIGCNGRDFPLELSTRILERASFLSAVHVPLPGSQVTGQIQTSWLQSVCCPLGQSFPSWGAQQDSAGSGFPYYGLGAALGWQWGARDSKAIPWINISPFLSNLSKNGCKITNPMWHQKVTAVGRSTFLDTENLAESQSLCFGSK